MRSLRIIVVIAAALVMSAGVCAAFILFTPKGADLVVRFGVSRIFGPGNVSSERLEGSLAGGIRVFNMEVRRLFLLPEGSVIRVQELDVHLVRPALDGLETGVVNARLILPKADNLVVNATLHNGRYDANAYSRSLDLAGLRSVIRHFRNFPLLQGELRDLDLALTGDLSRPVLQGVFTVDHIPNNAFVLYDAAVTCDLYFQRRGMFWETYGKLLIHRGALKTPHSVVHLGESRLIFSGDPLDPDLDIHATSVIARTRIDIMVRGKRKDPKISLTSDPALSQEQLLLMLTTGKRWDGIDMAMTTHRMTPELAGDFVDYFFFGKSGARIARMLGLSEISYKLDETVQGITLNKDLTDRLDVGYGVEIGTSGEQRQRELTQKVESEYRVSTHVTIGAQKEIVPPAPLGADAASRKIPDDRVFLRYRGTF